MEDLATLKDLISILKDAVNKGVEDVCLFMQIGRFNDNDILDLIFLYKVIDGVLYFKLNTGKEPQRFNSKHLLNMLSDLGIPEDTSIGIEFHDSPLNLDLKTLYTDFVKKIHTPYDEFHKPGSIYFWVYDK